MTTANQHRRAPMRFFAMPRDDRVDSTLALMADPYRYIARQSRLFGSDLFEARILLRSTICMTGPHASELFYDENHFTRGRAAPQSVRATLFGKSGMQSLDDAQHRQRKAMFMSLLTPDGVADLRDRSLREWRRSAGQWARQDRFTLYDAVQPLLTRAACAWAGMPLAEPDVARRSRQIAALFQDAAASAAGHLSARLARVEAEQWLSSLVRDVRAGRRDVPQSSAVHRIASHRDASGQLLVPRIAAAELLNLLRPTVAVSVYIVFIAHALHRHPEWRDALQLDSDIHAEPFVQEVRRFYPFVPWLAARAQHDFEWNGYRFRHGQRVMLDLYGTNHDPRCWRSPEQFRPERFTEERVTPFNLVAQGGGEPHNQHRCVGEDATVALMKAATLFLAREIRYVVPPQNLRVDMARLPALPFDRFILHSVRLA